MGGARARRSVAGRRNSGTTSLGGSTVSRPAVRPLDRLRGASARCGVPRQTLPLMSTILFADHDYQDISLERDLLARHGIELEVAQCQTEDDVIRAAQRARGILLQYAPITERVVAALPGLGIVSRIGAGFDTIDTRACAKHGVWVANSPDYGVGEVATHALALVLALVRNVVGWHRDVDRRDLALHDRRADQAGLRAHAGDRRPRPHRQAHGARLAQPVQARGRLRPLPDRRRFPGLRRARRAARPVRASRHRLAARAAQRRDARDDLPPR